MTLMTLTEKSLQMAPHASYMLRSWPDGENLTSGWSHGSLPSVASLDTTKPTSHWLCVGLLRLQNVHQTHITSWIPLPTNPFSGNPLRCSWTCTLSAESPCQFPTLWAFYLLALGICYVPFCAALLHPFRRQSLSPCQESDAGSNTCNLWARHTLYTWLHQH